MDMKWHVRRLIQTLALTLLATRLVCGLAFCQPTLPAGSLLDGYSFDNPSWLSDSGSAPIASTNLVLSSVGGASLLLDTTNLLSSFLAYPILATNGRTNLAFPAGALECAFICRWGTPLIVEEA